MYTILSYKAGMERMQVQVLVLGAVAFAFVGAFGVLRLASDLAKAVF